DRGVDDAETLRRVHASARVDDPAVVRPGAHRTRAHDMGYRARFRPKQLVQLRGALWLIRWRAGAEPPDVRVVRDLERAAVGLGKSLDVNGIAQARKLDRRRLERIRRTQPHGASGARLEEQNTDLEARRLLTRIGEPEHHVRRLTRRTSR